MSYTLQRALEKEQEARFVQIDFSAALHSVNHQGILLKLCSVAVGGFVQSVLAQFLFIRPQYVAVTGCSIKLVNVVSGLLQGRVLGSQFLLHTTELFSTQDNKALRLC